MSGHGSVDDAEADEVGSLCSIIRRDGQFSVRLALVDSLAAMSLTKVGDVPVKPFFRRVEILTAIRSAAPKRFREDKQRWRGMPPPPHPATCRKK